MRIIAFITHSADIRQMLDHIGVQAVPPGIAPARGPPLWEDCDAQMGEGAQVEPDWELAPQPAPDLESQFAADVVLVSNSDGANCSGQGRLDAQNKHHTSSQAIEFSICNTKVLCT